MIHAVTKEPIEPVCEHCDCAKHGYCKLKDTSFAKYCEHYTTECEGYNHGLHMGEYSG